MTNIVPFEFEGSAIRVVDIDGAPWFVGKDVAERLGYANATDAINKHCRGVAKRYPIIDALGRTQEARILSEPDRGGIRGKRQTPLLGAVPGLWRAPVAGVAAGALGSG